MQRPQPNCCAVASRSCRAATSIALRRCASSGSPRGSQAAGTLPSRTRSLRLGSSATEGSSCAPGSAPRAAGYPSAELLTLADEAVPVFEAAGDDRALGRALLLRGAVMGGTRPQRGWARAAERAAAHLARAGWPPWWCYPSIAAALFHGPVPVPGRSAAARSCSRRRRKAQSGARSPSSSSRASRRGAGTSSRRGRCSTRRTTLSTRSGLWGRRAGHRRDPRYRRAPRGERRRSAHVLGRSCDELERLADPTWLATRRARLADVLVSLGRHAEACTARRLRARRGRGRRPVDPVPLAEACRHGSTPPPATTLAPPASSARRPSLSTPPTASTSGPRSRSPQPRSRRPGPASRTSSRNHTERAVRLYRRKANRAALRLLGTR